MYIYVYIYMYYIYMYIYIYIIGIRQILTSMIFVINIYNKYINNIFFFL